MKKLLAMPLSASTLTGGSPTRDPFLLGPPTPYDANTEITGSGKFLLRIPSLPYLTTAVETPRSKRPTTWAPIGTKTIFIASPGYCDREAPIKVFGCLYSDWPVINEICLPRELLSDDTRGCDTVALSNELRQRADILIDGLTRPDVGVVWFLGARAGSDTIIRYLEERLFYLRGATNFPVVIGMSDNCGLLSFLQKNYLARVIHYETCIGQFLSKRRQETAKSQQHFLGDVSFATIKRTTNRVSNRSLGNIETKAILTVLKKLGYLTDTDISKDSFDDVIAKLSPSSGPFSDKEAQLIPVIKAKWSDIKEILQQTKKAREATSKPLFRLHNLLTSNPGPIEISSDMIAGNGVALEQSADVMGVLVGGHSLTTIESIGTFWQLETQGNIVLIEFLDLRFFRWQTPSRILGLLEKSRLLEGATAVIFGHLRADSEEKIRFYEAEVHFSSYLNTLGIPLYKGLMFGHDNDLENIPIPMVGATISKNSVGGGFTLTADLSKCYDRSKERSGSISPGRIVHHAKEEITINPMAFEQRIATHEGDFVVADTITIDPNTYDFMDHPDGMTPDELQRMIPYLVRPLVKCEQAGLFTHVKCIRCLPLTTETYTRLSPGITAETIRLLNGGLRDAFFSICQEIDPAYYSDREDVTPRRVVFGSSDSTKVAPARSRSSSGVGSK